MRSELVRSLLLRDYVAGGARGLREHYGWIIQETVTYGSILTVSIFSHMLGTLCKSQFANKKLASNTERANEWAK